MAIAARSNYASVANGGLDALWWFNGNEAGSRQAQAVNRIGAEADPAGGTRRVQRFTIQPGDFTNFGGSRCEVLSQQITLTEGQRGQLLFGVYLAAGFNSSGSGWNSLSDYHYPNNGPAQSPWTMSIRNGTQLYINIKGGPISSDGTRGTVEVDRLIATLTRQTWYTILVDLKQGGSAGTGDCNIWVNGVLVFSGARPTISSGVPNGVYIKQGFYHSLSDQSYDPKTMWCLDTVFWRNSDATEALAYLGGGAPPPGPGPSPDPTLQALARDRRFGKTTVGATRNGFSAGFKSGSKFATGLAPGELGDLKDFHLYVEGADGSTATQSLAVGVYADDGGSGLAGTKLGECDVLITAPGTDPGAWRKVTCASPIRITGANVWLIVGADAPTNRLRYATDTATGGLEYDSTDTFGAAPHLDDPFGAGALADIVMSICADYDVVSAAPRHVQSSSLTNDASAASVSDVFDLPVVSGNTIVVGVSWGAFTGAETCTVTDNLGNTYVLQDRADDTTHHQALATYVAKNVTGGPGVAVTVTASFSVSRGFRRIEILEYRDADATTPVAAHKIVANQAGTNAADNITTGNSTPAMDNTRVVGFALATSTTTPSASAGAGETPRQAVPDMLAEDKGLPTAGPVSSTFTFGVTGVTYHAAQILLKPATVVPPAPGPGGDTTAPVLVGATVTFDSIEIDYSEPLGATDPLPSDFSVTVNGDVVGINAVDVAGSKVTVGLDAPVLENDIVLLSYTAVAGRKVQDVAGNAAANLTNTGVTNLTGTGPGTPSLVVREWPDLGLNTITVTLVPGTEELDVYRTAPSGARSYVRGAAGLDVHLLATAFLSDYEAPFGVEVNYVAVGRDSSGETVSTPVPSTLAITIDYLNDLDDLRNSGPVTIESFRELSYDAQQGIHRPLGRRTPVVTSGLRWTPTARLVLITFDEEGRRKIRDAFGSTSPVLLRTPPEHGVGNMFLLATGNVVEERISRLAVAPERRFTIDVVQVDRPDPFLFAAAAVTWQDIANTFATWQDVLDGRPTWGDVLYSFTGITTPVNYSTEPDWPPTDA